MNQNPVYFGGLENGDWIILDWFRALMTGSWSHFERSETVKRFTEVSLTSFASVYSPMIFLAINPCRQCWLGFRLRPEAGRFVRPFSIPCQVLEFQYLRDFFYYFIIIICFYLGISWIYWLEDNRILRLNSSKLSHFFFFTYRVECLIGFPFPFNEIEVTISFSFLLGQGEREIQCKTQYTCWSNKKRAKEFCLLLQNIAHLCLILKTFLWVNGI